MLAQPQHKGRLMLAERTDDQAHLGCGLTDNVGQHFRRDVESGWRIAVAGPVETQDAVEVHDTRRWNSASLAYCGTAQRRSSASLSPRRSESTRRSRIVKRRHSSGANQLKAA